MSNFLDFSTATRTIIGPGCLEEGFKEAAALGTRPMVLSGQGLIERHPVMVDKLQQAFNTQSSVPFQEISREPTVEVISDLLRFARSEKVDMVISMGGGSVIDAGKALAAMLNNPGEIEDYLEVVGRGQPLTRRPVPFVAIPTTAGTGAEVTKNAVLGVTSMGVKVSLRSPLMLPMLVLVDSLLTHTMPRDLTISTGLDALTQLLEAFVSRKATPLTDEFCRAGLSRVGPALPIVAKADESNPEPEAREAMAMGAYLSGLALANSGLGVVHGFAGPLGGMLNAPHGQICAILLEPCTRANMSALEKLNGRGDEVLNKYCEAFSLLSGRKIKTAEEGLKWVGEYLAPFDLPNLASLGFEKSMIPDTVEKSQRASSMKGNPVALANEELEEILAGHL